MERMLRYALQLSYLNQLHKAGKITESEYLLLEETESNRKAKRDSLIMVYFQHPSFGSHSVTGTLG
jgi:hypothetical protein